MVTDFPAKTPSEEVWLPFDFADMVEDAETVLSATVTVSVVLGPDDVNPLNLQGSPLLADKVVTQLVTGGQNGAIYLVVCSVVTTPHNQKLHFPIRLPVYREDW